jgi:hypothetical protein
MADVAQILPYRTPFGTYKAINTLQAGPPTEFFPNCLPTAIRKVVLTSITPVSIGIGLDPTDAEQRVVPLPVTLLLAPDDHLFLYSPTPVSFQSLVEIY